MMVLAFMAQFTSWTPLTQLIASDRYAARELFGVDVPSGQLPLRSVRNADFKEVCLEVGGAPALRFASAYGFRNIQQLMRQMKRQRCVYDYVEVMACPSGEFHAFLQAPLCAKDLFRLTWRSCRCI